jgi:hypothetical protein
MRAQRAEHPDITFRSMLEAQWSAVFDELGLTWEYEPVKFDLPSGVYVPDVRITTRDGLSFWVEIKGPWPNAREFEVASEVNIYTGTPLVFLTGDVPRQANGGTAWWFDPDRRMWSMLRPEEALIRVIYRNTSEQPEGLGKLWPVALDEARHAELIKVGK